MSDEFSADATKPAVSGTNTAGGDGVVGRGRRGVVGESPDFQGVYGKSGDNAGVVGEADRFHAVFGVSHSTNNGGLFGVNDSQGGFGAIGVAQHGDGIGVSGESPNIGVRGTGRQGVVGISPTFQGVYGLSNANAGVVGEAINGGLFGVYAITDNPEHSALIAINSKGKQAGHFVGDVLVDGDLILGGADVAEQFDVLAAEADAVQPGSVVVLDEQGRIRTSDKPYDDRVAGIVSGAGDRVPALVLDRANPAEAGRPVAVTGKAWCLVDATDDPIRVGDLLTTSTRQGHARRATDKLASIGAVIGKALTALPSGTGQVLVLVGLA